jgi:iron complex outermembrane receptor protein
MSAPRAGRIGETKVTAGKFRDNLLMTLAAGVALAAMSTAARADGAASDAGGPGALDPGLRVQEVVVTSRKKEESIEKVPIAVSAITNQLKVADVRDLTDIVAFTPNVRIDPTYARADAADITIRGISPTRTDDNSIDSPIGFFIDGVYLGSLPGQIIENFDVDRIEVLRGPQGTLFGRNTVAGAVSVFRSEPTGDFGAKLQYTTGSWDDQEFRGVFNAPIIKDVLAAKVYYIGEFRDGYLHNTFLNDTQPKKDYQNMGVELKFTPDDRLKALLTVEEYADRSEGGAYLGNYNFCPGVVPAPNAKTNPNDVDASGGLLGEYLPGILGTGANVPCRSTTAIPNTISTSANDPGKVLTQAYTLNMTEKLTDNLKLVSITAYRHQHEETFFDFDGSSADFINIATDAHYHQFSQELRLEGNWDSPLGKVSFVTGGYYYDSYFNRNYTTSGDFWNFVGSLSGYDLDTDTWTNPALAASTGYANPVAACLAPRTTAALKAEFGNVQCDPHTTGAYGSGVVQRLYETQGTDSVAFFAHGDWEFHPNFTLTAGVRYTYERKHFNGYQAYLAPNDRAGDFDFSPVTADLTNHWEHVTPTAALTYQVTPDVMVYGSFSEGWHSGGFFGVNQDIADFISNQYKPETSESYEIGSKGQYFDHRLQVNVDAFLTEFQNKQESAVALDPTTQTVVTLFTNVGGVRYIGAEAEVQWILTRELHLTGTFGYLDAKYTSLPIDYPNAVNNNVPMPTNATFLVPRDAPPFTAGAEATYTKGIGPGQAQFTARGDWVDKEYTTLYNESYDAIGPHFDISASASYAWKNYKITAFGRNLTNHVIETPIYIAPLFAASTISPGRSWGLELAAKF